MTGALLLSLSLNAQLGLYGGYRFNDAPNWAPPSANLTDAASPLGNSWAVGADYWIPLGQTRIDLLPQLSFGQATQRLTVGSTPFEFTQNAFSLFLNTHFYLLDLEGDCDCPTFSKSGDFFQKGFFVQLSPGVSYFQNTIERQNPDAAGLEDNTLAYSLSAAVGLDIGLSDILTLTPMAGFRYYFPSEWASLSEVFPTIETEPFETESEIRQFWVGLRLGIRFDQR